MSPCWNRLQSTLQSPTPGSNRRALFGRQVCYHYISGASPASRAGKHDRALPLSYPVRGSGIEPESRSRLVCRNRTCFCLFPKQVACHLPHTRYHGMQRSRDHNYSICQNYCAPPSPAKPRAALPTAPEKLAFSFCISCSFCCVAAVPPMNTSCSAICWFHAPP